MQAGNAGGAAHNAGASGRVVVIGLTGLAGSGKSTVAQRLVERWGFTEFAFADALKEGLRAAFGLEPEDFQGARKEAPNDKLGGRSVRHAMRTMGTEWAQAELGRTIWVQVLKRRIEAERALCVGRLGAPRTANELDRIVISDVRFEHEAQFVRDELNGRLWIIQNPRVRLGGYRLHASEQGIDQRYIHRGLCNDRGIAELHATVDEFVRPVVE